MPYAKPQAGRAPRDISQDDNPVLLSVVVPMFNEEEGVDLLLARLEPCLAEITPDYEIVCVDDGSSDGTIRKLIAHRMRNERIKVVSLSRNFGKDTALSAGLDFASGAAVVPLDADLQDPPEVIPRMIEKWREGYDVVYGRRVSRASDGLAKRLSAQLFYKIHNLLADVRIPQDTGDFRLIDQRVIKALRDMPERTRFMKGLFTWVGFRQTGIEYERPGRANGETKWKPLRLWNFALDGIIGSTTVPLRIWTYAGLAIFLLAMVAATWLVARTLIHGVDVPGYASLMVTVLFLGGMNIFATGIIGEYIGRISVEVRNRPLYLVRELHGLDRRNSGEDTWSATSTAASARSKTRTGGSRRAAAS
jgi:glycosyltransferase involved in cell wall biosynthesis